MGLILTAIAYILLLILAPIGLIASLFTRPLNYFWRIAISLDQLGNVTCGEPMNLLLITQESISKFGDPDETISSVLGKNQRDKTLTRAGRVLVNLLDILDPNHAENSIE